MQEEVVNRTVTLAVNTSRMTTHVLKSALIKLLAEMKRSRDSPLQIPHGKQTGKRSSGRMLGSPISRSQTKILNPLSRQPENMVWIKPSKRTKPVISPNIWSFS